MVTLTVVVLHRQFGHCHLLRPYSKLPSNKKVNCLQIKADKSEDFNTFDLWLDSLVNNLCFLLEPK